MKTLEDLLSSLEEESKKGLRRPMKTLHHHHHLRRSCMMMHVDDYSRVFMPKKMMKTLEGS
jgi:hypothetical protein